MAGAVFGTTVVPDSVPFPAAPLPDPQAPGTSAGQPPANPWGLAPGTAKLTTIGGVDLGAMLFAGTGAPTSQTAPQGALYIRLDGNSPSTRLYVCTGLGGFNNWTSVTTAT